MNYKKKTPLPQTRKVLEDEIQHKCYVWFNNKYCLKREGKRRYIIFAVPNGGQRNVLEAIKMKNTGTLAGVSDLIIVLPYQVVFVEMKCKGGTVRDVQKDFKARTEENGHVYIVCYSEQDFVAQIERIVAKNESIAFTIERMIKGNLMFKLFRRMLKR